jgi:ligand-binding sensor domain-containing protein
MVQRSGLHTLAFCLSIALRAAALEPTTAAHQYARATWAEQEGLPSSLIWAITQDTDGYLWLGTGAGLVRFDGVRFTHVDELSTVPIRALLSARDGSLWMGMEAGSGITRRQAGGYTR